MKKIVLKIISLILIVMLLVTYAYGILFDNITTKEIVGFKHLKLQDVVTQGNVQLYNDENSSDHIPRDLIKTFSSKLPNVKAKSYTGGINDAIDHIRVTFSFENRDLCIESLDRFRKSTFSYYDVEMTWLPKVIEDNNRRTISMPFSCKNVFVLFGSDLNNYEFIVDYSSSFENKLIRDFENEALRGANRKIEKENADVFLNDIYKERNRE